MALEQQYNSDSLTLDGLVRRLDECERPLPFQKYEDWDSHGFRPGTLRLHLPFRVHGQEIQKSPVLWGP